MKIVLKTLSENEFPLIVEWVNAHDKDFIFQWAGNTYIYPLTVQQMEDHYSNGINSINSGTFVYKIIDMETQDIIGTVQLGRIDLTKGEAFVGRFLVKSEQYRNQGIGTTALQELVRTGFEEFSLQRIKLNVFDINTRAIRCYENIGFIQTQIFKNVYKSLDGQTWNGIEMVLDKDHWEKT